MRLDKVMDEAARVLEQITGLRVHDYPPADLSPPAGYVSYPTSLDINQAYQRGEDGMTDLPMVLVIGPPTDRTTRDTVAMWASGDGAQSVVRAFEEHTWTSCDDCTISKGEFDVETIAGVPYLAIIFKATVVGPGQE